ncbi:hypothetical protein KC349_g3051 [Hortaea werneckii]|nr:hypothetical protein KC349_g3051 [Hortaea werneckii]
MVRPVGNAGEGRPLLPNNNNERSSYITFDAPNGAPTKHSKASTVSKAKRYLSANVSNDYTDFILIVCFAISGLIDSGAYNAYSCFTSMQTGNTVFAALGVSDLPASSPKFAWTKSVTSVASFLIGAAITGFFHRFFGERKRWVLSFAFAVQTVLVAVAAYLVDSNQSSGSPVKRPSSAELPENPGFPWMDLVPIGLLSFQSAGKVIASRIFKHNGLPTTVLTTLYSDLMSDPKTFTAGLFDNQKRNGRVAGLAFYFGGAVAGGAFAKSVFGFSGLLWTVAGVKTIIVIAWLLWRAEEPEEGNDGC